MGIAARARYERLFSGEVLGKAYAALSNSALFLPAISMSFCQYFPGKQPLVASSRSDTHLPGQLNTRPRKTLEWKCPAEVFLPEGAFDFKTYWKNQLNLVALGA